MSGAQHTPGPWRTALAKNGSGDVAIVSNPAMIVAECFSAIRHKDEAAQAEALANARLIAAAPDMLEAISSTIGALEAEFGPRVAQVNFPALYSAQAKAIGGAQ